jgi:hypothetical protein
VGNTLVEVGFFEVLDFINFNFLTFFRLFLGLFIFLVNVVTIRLRFFFLLAITFVIFALIFGVVLEFRGSVNPGHDTGQEDESLLLGQGASFQSLDNVVHLLETVGHQIVNDSVARE